MRSRFQRAVVVAFYGFITYQFVHAGALALMIYVLALEDRQPAGIVAAIAAGFFFYVAVRAIRALKTYINGVPPLT